MKSFYEFVKKMYNEVTPQPGQPALQQSNLQQSNLQQPVKQTPVPPITFDTFNNFVKNNFSQLLNNPKIANDPNAIFLNTMLGDKNIINNSIRTFQQAQQKPQQPVVPPVAAGS